MATIALVLDLEPGHILPTFHLARSLEERGHRVTYVGIADAGPHVERQGFDFQVLFPEHYPPGSYERLRERTLERLADGRAEEADPTAIEHLRHLMGGGLDPVLEHIRPDLILSSYFFSLETLILLDRYRPPVVLLTPFLRTASQGPEKPALLRLMRGGPIAAEITRFALTRRPGLRTLDQLIAPLVGVPELIACPEELEIPGPSLGPGVHYIESCVRRRGEDVARDEGFPWERIPSDRRLIFASLGSQTELSRERAARVLGAVFEAARRSASEPWHFVVALPEGLERAGLGGDGGDHVTVCRWAPQLALLERADAMITHGGLGTVKECIHARVPMVVTPLHRDQPANARRVEHHRLGTSFAPETVTGEDLVRALRGAVDEGRYRDGLARMGAVFDRRQEERVGARRVEEILPRSGAGPGQGVPFAGDPNG